MDTVRYFKLKNWGGFVAQIQVLYKEKKTDSEGNLSYDAEWKTWSPSGYHDICVDAERTSDLYSDANLPEGAQVKLKAVVCGGQDKTASETYEYSSSSGKMAAYKISGTTCSNSLQLESYK